MKSMKRISKVTVKRMADNDPDTSWLGHYSDRAESDYAIDRKHSLDCQINNPPTEGIAQLERVSTYLETEHNKLVGSLDWQQNLEAVEDLSESIDTLADAIGELEECDCSERGDAERGEYRYFNGCVENYKGESPENIRKYVRQDYERMERLARGDWGFIGIRAEAEIAISDDPHKRTNTTWTLQEITSGGLWGIESDSDKSYLAEIETEQLSELREQLRALGFSTRAITTALKTLTHVNE
jgi:hypothetical protein